MRKKKIIMSFDYELYFGIRSGTVLKSIIEPTNMLMDTMEKYSFRGNFFVDYLMFRELEKLDEERAQSDLRMLKNQVKDMVRRGHRIELHLHPHWIDAVYNGDGTWNYSNFTHYSLSSLDEETIVSMFKEGTAYLTNLAREVLPDYRICAFRAGGWAVQPFDKLKQGFIESGIMIDSSTSYGMFDVREKSSYDFRNMPEKAYYHFDDDVCKEVENGRFLEVPISSFHNSFILFCFNSYVYRHTDMFKSLADGTHFRKGTHVVKKSLYDKISDKFNPMNRHMVTFSTLMKCSLNRALRQTRGEFCVFIDHPKDISKGMINGINYLGNKCESINYVDLVVKL